MKKLLKYVAIFIINIRARNAAFTDVLARSGSLLFRIWMFSQLYVASYKAVNKSAIGGLSVAMVIWSIILVQAFRTATRPRVFEIINEEVKSGTIAYSLIKPVSFMLFHYYGFMGRAIPNIISNISVGIIFAYIFKVSIPITIGGIFGGCVLLFFGYMLDFLINFTIGIMAFWCEDNEPFNKIYQHIQYVFGGVILPISLFPGTIRTVAEYLPFSHLFYSASRIIVNFDERLFFYFLSIQICWLIAGFLIAYVLFKRGVKYVSIQGG